MISVFDLFKIGIGPSSSHTVGPMIAAHTFASQLDGARVASVTVTLYGSLSLTGKGHATDRAVTLGLAGFHPATVNSDEAGMIWQTIRSNKTLALAGRYTMPFDTDTDIIFVDKPLPEHPNGMLFTACDSDGNTLVETVWFSLGGGFIARREQLLAEQLSAEQEGVEKITVPYPFASAQALLEQCENNQLTVAELVLANEQALGRAVEEVNAGLDRLWLVMDGCIDRGCRTEGELPGGLQVQRRAPDLFKRWQQEVDGDNFLQVMDWVSLCAMAVNEENAAGGRVVTAPTNGAAGVIPAVLAFHKQYDKQSSPESMRAFLLTAAAVGVLYKRNASISAAEVGCQGEIGVASSMAAAALAAVWGGTVAQVENAAEIAMEHHLGMTCDPVAGLVQVPCIERNSMGAVKAINAARLALCGDGCHRVSLDQVIATMYQTGRDMQDIYKETSLGGLAVNVVYC